MSMDHGEWQAPSFDHLSRRFASNLGPSSSRPRGLRASYRARAWPSIRVMRNRGKPFMIFNFFIVVVAFIK